jgi:proteic killer suppression protein
LTFRQAFDKFTFGANWRSMELRFNDPDLERLEVDLQFTGGRPPAIVKAYRKQLNFIRQAQDERDLRAWESLRMEKVDDGERQYQYSIRLNDQWKLVVELELGKPTNKLVIISIEDYQ